MTISLLELTIHIILVMWTQPNMNIDHYVAFRINNNSISVVATTTNLNVRDTLDCGGYYYFVVGYDSLNNEIIRSDTAFIETNVQTGIETHHNNNSLLFPNPVHGTLHMLGFDIDKLTICDMLGRKFTININHNQVNVANLPNGQYIIIMQHPIRFIKF